MIHLTEKQLSRFVWDTYQVRDMIRALGDQLTVGHKFANKRELAQWCIEHQPHYHGYIPEVVNYFASIYNVQ